MTIAAGTGYERMMVPSATFGSTFPGAQSVDEVVGDFSVANRLSSANLEKMKNFYTKRSKHCILEVDHFDNAIFAFVEEMKDKPREVVYRELRHWMVYTTVVHEIGHTWGSATTSRPRQTRPTSQPVPHRVQPLVAGGGAAPRGARPGHRVWRRQRLQAVRGERELHPHGPGPLGGTSVMDYSRYFDGWLATVGRYRPRGAPLRLRPEGGVRTR